tara:strand:- start:467 stop:964 length:498 start_codon:yes stop_codon:yes gene_type:complete
MVTGLVYDFSDDENGPYVYILPNPVNERLTFPSTVDRCLQLNSVSKEQWGHTTFAIENVAYQKALPQQLETKGLDVLQIKPAQDKRSRLALTSHMVQSGRVLFPRKGCELLMSQLTHFGVEKHDDLADAFAYTILSVIDEPPAWCGIWWLHEDEWGELEWRGGTF